MLSLFSSMDVLSLYTCLSLSVCMGDADVQFQLIWLVPRVNHLFCYKTLTKITGRTKERDLMYFVMTVSKHSILIKWFEKIRLCTRVRQSIRGELKVRRADLWVTGSIPVWPGEMLVEKVKEQRLWSPWARPLTLTAPVVMPSNPQIRLWLYWAVWMCLKVRHLKIYCCAIQQHHKVWTKHNKLHKSRPSIYSKIILLYCIKKSVASVILSTFCSYAVLNIFHLCMVLLCCICSWQ